MAMIIGEYHGTPSQRSMMQRAESLWSILRDDPRFCCHGRDVQLSNHTVDNLELQMALARLQGAAGCCGVSRTDAVHRLADLEKAGFAVDAYVEWHGDETYLDVAEHVVESRKLSDGIQVKQIDPNTPHDTMAAVDAVAQSCGVLLPNGAFVRGQARQGVCLYACAGEGDVVATAASITQFHPTHARGGQALWGMLATREDHRGQGLAVVLGAMAMLAMKRQYGIRQVFTGIREGNTPSENLCANLGLKKSESMDVFAVDKRQIPEGRTTK